MCIESSHYVSFEVKVEFNIKCEISVDNQSKPQLNVVFVYSCMHG